jgi:hypothetical protein
MLRSSVFFLRSKASHLVPSYFFVDTNVVINYENDLQNVRDFVDDPMNVFFYTETVRKELSVRSGPIPEKFRFHFSKLTLEQKNLGIKMLGEIWHKRFDDNPHCIREGFGLTEKQLEKFKNDLFIIFEASVSCHKPGVLPDTMLATPPLLTRNMNLLKKFLLKEKTEDVLEDTINLCGFEHLLPVLDLNDAIDEWLVAKKTG